MPVNGEGRSQNLLFDPWEIEIYRANQLNLECQLKLALPQNMIGVSLTYEKVNISKDQLKNEQLENEQFVNQHELLSKLYVRKTDEAAQRWVS